MENSINPGWIYILKNESLQDSLLKIGRTINDPYDRALELSSVTGVATPFEVIYSEPVPDCVQAESLVHKKLAQYRVNTNREFFQVDFRVAQQIIHDIGENMRNHSPLCRRCEIFKTTKEYESYRKELLRLKLVIKGLRAYISFVKYGKSYISRLITIFQTIFSKIVPNAQVCQVYFWALVVPLCFAVWIVTVVLFPKIAEFITLTVVLISAVMVIGSVHKELHNQE